MEFTFQSYRTTKFRPSPEITVNSEEQILIASTPWGSREIATRINSDILDYLSNVKNDVELTSPFPLVTSLSSLTNSVRTSIMLANEFVFRNNNKESYTEGVETIVVMKKQDELCIGNIGQPLILAKYKDSKELIPIQIQKDIQNTCDPLPEDVLGMDSNCYPHLLSFKSTQIDELILLAHTNPTIKTLAALESSYFNFDKIEKWTHSISQTQPHVPFWLGRLIL